MAQEDRATFDDIWNGVTFDIPVIERGKPIADETLTGMLRNLCRGFFEAGRRSGPLAEETEALRSIAYAVDHWASVPDGPGRDVLRREMAALLFKHRALIHPPSPSARERQS